MQPFNQTVIDAWHDTCRHYSYYNGGLFTPQNTQKICDDLRRVKPYLSQTIDPMIAMAQLSTHKLDNHNSWTQFKQYLTQMVTNLQHFVTCQPPLNEYQNLCAFLADNNNMAQLFSRKVSYFKLSDEFTDSGESLNAGLNQQFLKLKKRLANYQDGGIFYTMIKILIQQTAQPYLDQFDTLYASYSLKSGSKGAAKYFQQLSTLKTDLNHTLDELRRNYNIAAKIIIYFDDLIRSW